MVCIGRRRPLHLSEGHDEGVWEYDEAFAYAIVRIALQLIVQSVMDDEVVSCVDRKGCSWLGTRQ